MFKKRYLAIILFTLALFEVGLRVTGVYKVYSEKLGTEYTSYWGFEHKGYYKILPRNKRMQFEQKEFKVDYSTNSFGMRNPEIAGTPKDSVVRVLCLGDSFTQGDGATNGNSYPRQLERMLNKNASNTKFEVVNAGNNGSDILYSERLFEDFAFGLKPKVVVVLINDSDIADIIIRGGVERFKEDNRTQFNNGPWYEKLYSKCHVVRFVVHGILQKSYLFLSPKAEKREEALANETIAKSMTRLSNFCADKQIEIYFIVHPLPSIIKNKKERSKLALSAYSGEGVYDINDYLRDTLSQLQYESYAWPLNGHFNDFGYKIMAEKIYKELSGDGAFTGFFKY